MSEYVDHTLRLDVDLFDDDLDVTIDEDDDLLDDDDDDDLFDDDDDDDLFDDDDDDDLLDDDDDDDLLDDDDDDDLLDDDDDFLNADLDSDDDILASPDHSQAGAAVSYVNFEPTSVDMKDVVGNVVEDMANWHVQEGNTCAVCAQEFVLEGLTGNEFDMNELRELAEENGWYNINGTPGNCVGNLLEHYGLDVERGYGISVQDMQNCLENGGKVIVGVDADELWSGQNEEWFFPGRDVDHAVQLVGFDHSDPDNPMVILNDSGVANGCGATVPLDVFNDAYEDSGRFAVMAYAPQEGEFA